MSDCAEIVIRRILTASKWQLPSASYTLIATRYTHQAYIISPSPHRLTHIFSFLFLSYPRWGVELRPVVPSLSACSTTPHAPHPCVSSHWRTARKSSGHYRIYRFLHRICRTTCLHLRNATWCDAMRCYAMRWCIRMPSISISAIIQISSQPLRFYLNSHHACYHQSV